MAPIDKLGVTALLCFALLLLLLAAIIEEYYWFQVARRAANAGQPRARDKMAAVESDRAAGIQGLLGD